MRMKKDIAILIGLFSAAFLIRVTNVSNVCMYGDEWIYMSKAHAIVSSNFIPIAETFRHVNPFLLYVGAVVTVLFGGDLNTLRMVSVIFGSLTVPMMYLFGKAIYDRKTGLLSSLFLCFSSFHCLWSRIFMFEAATVFFITAFMYFFWLSQRSDNRRRTTYSCIAGAMLGLAIAAKYIAFFLIPAIFAYVLWTKKFIFKSLIDKQILLIFLFAFLFILPLIICLHTTGVGIHPLYYQAVERFDKTSIDRATVVGGAIRDLPIDSLLVKGSETITNMLCRGSEVVLPWPTLFRLSAMLLFAISFLFYLPTFINRKREDSFLMLLFLTFYVFLVILCSRHDYYVIYSLPFYFVMFAHFFLKSFEYIKDKNNCKNIFVIFIFLLFLIVLLSSIVVSVTSPYWDEGDTSWAKSGVDYIKNDLANKDYKGDITIGVVTLPETIDYHLHFSSDINASYIHVLDTTSTSLGKFGSVDIERIGMLKPDYLVANEPMYEHFFKEKNEVLEDYRVAFHYATYPNRCYILKRKEIQPESAAPSCSGGGEISRDIFERSIPEVVKAGNVYTALVQVKNTGDSRANFTVRVHSDEYTIFVYEWWAKATIDKGSTHLFKFKIVPIKKCAEKLPITVDLYVKDEKNERQVQVDSFSDYLYVCCAGWKR